MVRSKGKSIPRIGINSSRNASLPSSGWKGYGIISLPPTCQTVGDIQVSAVAGLFGIQHWQNFDGPA